MSPISTAWLAMVQKEMREAWRDRRALIAAMAIAVMAPIVIYAATQTAINEAVERPDIYINITGAEFAPRLLSWLTEEGIHDLKLANPDQTSTWKERDINLTIPEDYADSMQAGKPADVMLRADFSEKALVAPLRRINRAVSSYSREISTQRLVMRGTDLQLLRPIQLHEQDTAPTGNNTGFITILLVLYLMLAAFMSGLPIAVDSSAGERERQVLELLLCQPVSTMQIVLSKLTVASLVSAVGVTLTLFFSSLVIPLIDLARIGLAFTLDLATAATLLAILLPLSVFAGSLQLFVAFFARSFKEAQSTVSMVMMLPALAPMALTFVNDRPEVLTWLPITGQYLLLEAVFKGSGAGMGESMVTSSSTLLICAALCWILSRRLLSQKAILSLG